MILMQTNPLLGPLEGVGLENLDFLGSEMAQSENGFARLEIITSRAKWTTSTLIVKNLPQSTLVQEALFSNQGRFVVQTRTAQYAYRYAHQ